MLREGDRFGRYVIVKSLGRGGMGDVYRARDPRLARDVAIKLLAIDASAEGAGEEARARLLREARAAAAIDHPNAVRIFDVGEVDGVPFLSMEFVRGQTL